MTDRELLELAAKAAGYEVVGPAPKYIAQGCNEWALIICNDRGGDSVFDPLTDDGDALRLAVRLGFAVSIEYQVGSTAVLWGPPMGNVREPHGTDQLAATRRAIVRAAAAIGKAMP